MHRQEECRAVCILLVRAAVGAMFALSGWHKLFDPKRRQLLEQTLQHNNIPCVQLDAPIVSATGLIAGTLLLMGLFAIPAAVALAVITLGAILFDAWRKPGVKQPPSRHWLKSPIL